jgi:hypothetical protein
MEVQTKLDLHLAKMWQADILPADRVRPIGPCPNDLIVLPRMNSLKIWHMRIPS